MRRLAFSALVILFVALNIHAQAAADAPEQKLADDFLKRLNALTDWHLTVDGKEDGLEPLVNNMMELFAPDALAEVPPHDKE